MTDIAMPPDDLVSAPPQDENFAADIRDIGERSSETSVSPKGARGAFQVMPATAASPGFGVKPAQSQSLEEFDRVGNDYSAALLTHYNGNRALASAAYNAGPGNVEKWVQQFGDPRQGHLSDAAFVAKIPIAETRDYAGRMLAANQPPGDLQTPPSDLVAPSGGPPPDLQSPPPDLVGGTGLKDIGIAGEFGAGAKAGVTDIGKTVDFINKSLPPGASQILIKTMTAALPGLDTIVSSLVSGLGLMGQAPAPEPTVGSQPLTLKGPLDVHSVAEKTVHGLGASLPMMAGAMVGGPLAAGGTAAVQAFGPRYEEELQKNPADQQGAIQRAGEAASIDGAATALGWKLFEFTPFKQEAGKITNEITGQVATVYKQTIRDMIKNLTLQGLGIQPAVAVVSQAVHNFMDDKPITEGLPEAYVQGGIGTTLMMGLSHIITPPGMALSPWRTPKGPTPYDPSVHFGAKPPIEPEGGSPPGPSGPGGAAPAGRLTGPAPPAGLEPGKDIGLPFPDGTVQRATVEGHPAPGVVRLKYEDGTVADHVTAEIQRDAVAAPPERQPENQPVYRGPQLSQEEREAPPLEESEPVPPSARAAAKIARRAPQPVLDPVALHALDLADRLEKTALDPTMPMSNEDRQAALLQVGRLRQAFAHEGEETRPGGYRHPVAGEPAANLGALAAARAAHPDNYGTERFPGDKRQIVSRETPEETAGPPVRPPDLLQFLGRRGGISGNDPYIAGNLQKMDAHRKFIPGAGMLVRQTGGLSIDKARELAGEMGYGQDYHNFETTEDLMDAIRDSLAGKDVFSGSENGGREAVQRWRDHQAAQHIRPEEEHEAVGQHIDDLRTQAADYGIPYGEDWTAEDLMAAIHEREAIHAERAGGDEPSNLADALELNMDYYLAHRWPEQHGQLKDEGIAEEASHATEGQPPAQPEAAEGAGEGGPEAGTAPGREAGAVEPGGDAGERGPAAPPRIEAPALLETPEETPAARKAREGRRKITEAAQLPRAHNETVQRPADEGLFAPPPPESAPSLLDRHTAEQNANPEPSEAQISSGNYKKGHLDFQGLKVSIETPSGAERRGVGPTGESWAVKLQHPYGYVKGSKGADGEQVDVYIGPHTDSPDVFVVDQIDPKTGAFDEHKAVLGARTEEEAGEIYTAGFSDGSGRARAGAITAMPVDEFRDWLDGGHVKEPLAYREPYPVAAQAAAPELPTKGELSAEAQDLGLQVSPNATRAEIAGAVDLRTANVTPDAQAAEVRDTIEARIDQEAAQSLPEVFDEEGWHSASAEAAAPEPEAAGRVDEAGEQPVPAAGEAPDRGGAAAEPEGGGHPGGEGAAPPVPGSRPVDDNKNPIFQKGERVVLTNGPLAGRHGEIVNRITSRMVNVFGPREERTSYHYTVKTDEGAEELASKFEAETARPAQVVKDPVWDGHSMTPDALQRTIEYAKRNVERFKDSAERARLPQKKADWRREAENAQQKADGASAVLAAWEKQNPAAAKKAATESVVPVAAEIPQPPVAGVKVTRNADRNGVEVRFTARPDDAVIGKLKASGFRWSRPQKLWYARYSDRTWQVANALKGEEAKPFTTTPGAISAEHTAEVSRLEAEGAKDFEAAQRYRAFADKTTAELRAATLERVVDARQHQKMLDEIRAREKEAGASAALPDNKARVAAIAKIKALNEQSKPYAEKDDLTAAEARIFKGLMKEIADLQFEIARPLNVEKVKSEADRKSTLPALIVVKAHEDLMRDKGIYDAITEAAHGVAFNADTPIDSIMLGRNPAVSPAKLYENFAGTRDALRSHFGPTIRLFRAEGLQKEKPTKNWATTKEYAEQFGNNVISQDVPIDDVVAVNVGPKGGYHEIIVGKKPADAVQAKGWREIGQNAAGQTLYEDERGVRSRKEDGIRYSEPLLLSQLRHGIEAATNRDQHPEFKLASEVTPTEQAADQGAAQGGQAELDAAEYQPAAMPITAASPPPAKPPVGDLFSAGDAVQPRPAAASTLPPREGPRYVTGVSDDGKQVTLDGGAILPAGDIEPISGHGLQGPVRAGAAGQRPGTIPGSAEARPTGGVSSGKEPGSPPVAGRPAGAASQGSGRPAKRPAGPAPRRGAGEIADAGIPRPGEGSESGTAGRPDAGVKGENFSIEPGEVAEGRGPKLKAADNLSAIRLAKRLIAEGRPATRDEQALLAKYVGWGGLSGAFEGSDGKFSAGFEDIGRDLKEVLTPEEYRTAARSTQYAHYTAENVIRSMWDAVAAMGFKGGNVFEPGMGVGHFLGMMPPDIAAASQYQGIELDHLTADIAKLLYPQSGVRQADFTQTPLPDNIFDLVIGNPPFSDTVIKADPKYAARGFMLHDYFFAKSLDAVRPGGLLGFVTSAGTMNKLGADARHYLAERAEFLGGVRLPFNAFKKNAGTEVTTDILFFKKRDEPISNADAVKEPWTGITQRTLPNADGGTTRGNVSRYFSEHPEQVLGREGFFDKLYKDRYAVHAPEGVDLTENLQAALDRLPKDIYQPEESPRDKAALDFGGAEKKDGSFYIQDGRVMQYSGGAGRAVAKRGPGVEGGVTAPALEKIRKLIPIRDALRDVFAHDLADRHQDAADARRLLNLHYDAFVRQFGPINKAEFQERRPNVIQQESARAEAREQARDRGEAWHEGSFNSEPMFRNGSTMQEVARARANARAEAGASFDEGSFNPEEMPDIIIEKRPNIDPFMDDQESYRLRAIENYNDSTGDSSKKRVFFESVLTRETEPQLNSANDGVLWSLNKFGRLDLDAIAKQMGREKGDLVAELGNSVFKMPNTHDTYQTSDEYLSGDIPDKLAIAQTAAQHDPDIRRNIEALQAAMPAPLAPSEISMRLGMPWMPQEITEHFARDHLRIGEAIIKHNPALGGWTINPISNGPDMALWGTDSRNAHQILSDALNRTPPRVYKEIYVPGEGKKREFDPIATQAAQDKYEAIRNAFDEYVHAEPERAEKLAGEYNDKLNRTVLRKFDGSYLTTPGVASDWSWRPHQQRVVARIIQSGNTYVAHAVGAGKTSEMIGAGMEMRRLGLVKKPMYVVPNHMLAQFTKEFYEQYPTARIAVADERRFHTDRRKQFIANVAQDDLDAVIITHSAFGKIPISGKFQNEIILEELDKINEAMEGLDKQDDRVTIKRLENQKEKLEQQLRAAMGNRKDQTNTFEEMGVDFTFVDEAHNFRKLSLATRQSSLKGITPEGSQMAWDLYAKIRYLESRNPGRSAVLASGTPITNTMGELYTISRYLQREELQNRGIEHFDSWASTFGDTKSELEQNAAGGYQSVTRFSKFVNIPELYKMVGGIMDVVTPHQLDQFVVRPKLKGGKRQFNLAPQSDLLSEYQGGLGRRMEAIKNRKGPPKKGDDIMLSIINDGRHAAIDMRFVDPFAPNDPDSKLNQMISNVHRIWKETRSTQFMDPRSNYDKPLAKGAATQMIFANLGIGTGENGEKFSGYDWMKRELIRLGVPKDEIAFIRDHKSSVARQKLFNDMNEGKVRILIGSTQKMGTGVNAQRKLYAIHNQDPLWYPADDEQRVGRGLRQGNTNPEIEIHDYSVKGTYDSVMWQMMGRKARFIEQFFRGDPELRDMEDLGEASQYEQASAISTSDERIMQLTDLRQQLDRAQRRESAHEREQYSMRSRLRQAQETVERVDRGVPVIEADIAKRTDTAGDKFKMKVGSKTFTDRGEAAEAMKERYAELWPALEKDHDVKIAEIGGFDVHMVKEGLGLAPVVHFYMKRSNGDLSEIGASTPNGVIRSMENRLPKLEDEVKWLENQKAEAEQQVASLRAQIGKPFTGGDEITRLRKEVKDLEAQLAPKKELSADDIQKQIDANQASYDAGDLTDDEFAQRDIELRVLKQKAEGGAPSATGTKAQAEMLDQTSTPEFKRWFGDSKVVDENGKPLRVYHGTNKDFSEFNTSSFFSANPDHAKFFAGHTAEDGPPDRRPTMIPAYLSLKNPLILDGSVAPSAVRFGAYAINRAKSGGHDGVILRNFRDANAGVSDTFIAFHPEQIKSATGNSGTFDASNPDIRAQEQVPQREEGTSSKPPKAVWLGSDLVAQLPERPTEPEARLIEQISKIARQIVPTAKVVPAKSLMLVDEVPDAPNSESFQVKGRNIWGATYIDGPRRTIAWALGSPDAVGTFRHEVIHWLRNLGFFTPKEWGTLVKAAEDGNWIGKHDIDRRYKDLDHAGKIEEAIAEEGAGWNRKENTPEPPIRRLFARLRDFLQRTRRYLQSLFGHEATADDIFRDIMSGKIGKRPINGEKPVSEETFAQAAKNPEGPVETPQEGRDYIDDTANDLAEHMREKGPGTYERVLQHLNPPSGPELFLRANWLQQHVMGPRTVAELDTKSGKFWSAVKAEEAEGHTRVNDLRDNIAKTFLKLPRAAQDKVNSVMELDRLAGRSRQNDGRSIVAKNEAFEHARGSKPGETVILNPKESAAYFELQNMYRRAWDGIMEGTARRMGWIRPWSPAMVDNLRLINKAVDDADHPRNRKAFQRLADIMNAMDAQRRSAYMPLMRFGDYYISVKPKDGTDMESTGGFPKSVWFEMAERPSMDFASVDPMKMLRGDVTKTGEVPDYAKAKLEELKKRFPPDKYRHETGYLFSKPDALRSLSIPAVEKLFMLMESGVMDRLKTETAMGGFANKPAAHAEAKKRWKDLYDELVDAVHDEMYENLKAGFKKKSNTVPGYSGDWNRVLGSYMNWTSRHVARQIHGDTIERAYDDIQTSHPHQSIKTFWKKWKQDDENPTSPISRIGMAANQIGFLYTLAWNPASTTSIMLHGPNFAMPVLSTGIGMAKASKAFTSAFGEALAAMSGDAKQGLFIDIRKVGKTPDERAFLRQMETDGDLHAKGADDVRSMGHQASAMWGANAPIMQRSMDIVSSNIAAADQANRVATALSAYRLARDGNLGAMNTVWSANQVWRAMALRDGVSPETMAKFLLPQAVGEWGGRARTEFGRTPIGRMGTALHGFQIRYLSNLVKQAVRQGPEGRVALAWTLAALWAVAGLQGLPFAQDAENFMDFIWKALTKHDPMIEWRIRALLADSGLGKVGADLVMRGPLSVLTGADFSSRLGFGKVITDDVMPWFGGDEAALTFPSIVMGVYSAVTKRAKSHQPESAAAAVLPGGLRHPIQAVIDSQYGAKSQSGTTTYVSKRKFTAGDAVKEALGLTPLDVARAREHGEYQFRAKNAHGSRPRDMTPK